MKLPFSFQRAKPAGSIKLLGNDTLPAGDAAPSTNDNSYACRTISMNGWPVQRFALWAVQSVSGPVALPIVGYVFDKGTNLWLPMPASAANITPGVVGGALTGPVYFDYPTLVDLNHTQTDLAQVESGNANLLFIVSDNTAPNGTYTFMGGPMLSSKGY